MEFSSEHLPVATINWRRELVEVKVKVRILRNRFLVLCQEAQVICHLQSELHIRLYVIARMLPVALKQLVHSNAVFEDIVLVSLFLLLHRVLSEAACEGLCFHHDLCLTFQSCYSHQADKFREAAHPLCSKASCCKNR